MNPDDKQWLKAILSSKSTVQDVISNMNASSLRIVLIVNEKGKLEGTVSDGDIRRGLLRGVTLSSSVESVIHRGALVATPAMSRDVVLQLMVANKVQQIPVVDDELNVMGLHLWDEISIPARRSNFMVIMAGGRGSRLHPFTANCPKPLVNVAGKPMLEHIIERAKLEGIKDFVISVHYLGHMIQEYFGDGSDFGVNVEYLIEKTPLGTAGALSLFTSRPKEVFIVTNGDVLTDIRYGDLIDFHLRYSAMATMAVRTHEWQHPYGVVKILGSEIIGFEEKPIARSYINAGVYALSPESLDEIKPGEVCDMPILFERLRTKECKTVAYPMHEPWLDIGRPDDLIRAHQALKAEDK